MPQPKINDTELSEGLFLKDKKAFDLIYEKYWKRLYYYAFKIFGDKVVCEDVIQEVFIKLWEKASERKIENLEGYLFRAVKFQISNAIRNQKDFKPFENFLTQLPTDLSADSILELKETSELILQSVESLPEKCREVYKLSREEQLTNNQIADQMNISVRTVEAHIYKALKSIKNNLGEIYFLFFLLWP